MITAAERFYRCGRVCNGAAESPAMPKGPGRCFRVWNGAEVSAAAFHSYNTVTESEMLPKSLRHRYRLCNFKDFRACLTRNRVQWAAVSGEMLTSSFIPNGF